MITEFKFFKSAFGAQNMPIKEFAQELVNNYNLPTMHSYSASSLEEGLEDQVRELLETINGITPSNKMRWRTSDSDNYKNGWGANISNSGYIEVFVTNKRGKTSFN
ncbi:hypothetical protein AGMMS50276_19460 [Synergistales bacterium]|nr:hypothetical protein AGMMS50276_19460 [Synergistales bacterium]